MKLKKKRLKWIKKKFQALLMRKKKHQRKSNKVRPKIFRIKAKKLLKVFKLNKLKIKMRISI